MDEQRAAVGDPSTPIAQVRPGRRVPVGAVDVQHIDRTRHRFVSRRGERGHVADPVGDAGTGEVPLERFTVVSGLGGVAAELLRAAVIAGVRIDGHDLRTPRRGSCQHDRRAPSEAADLHDPPAFGAASCGREQPPSLVVRHPSFDVLGRRQRGVDVGSCALLAHRRYTPSPYTTTHASPSNCRMRSLAKTSSGAAPRPCSSTSA